MFPTMNKEDAYLAIWGALTTLPVRTHLRWKLEEATTLLHGQKPSHLEVGKAFWFSKDDQKKDL